MSYRHLPVTKIVKGKTKRYKNLAAFNTPGPSYGGLDGARRGKRR